MQYAHIIWDWNGTLLNDAWLCREVMNNLLARRDKPSLSEERYQHIFDFPVREYYQRAGFDFAHESFEVLGAEFMDEYDARRYECELQSGCQPVLEAVQARGLTQHVLSAYHQKALEASLHRYQIREYFTSVTGLEDIYAHGKVEQGRRMLAHHGIDPKTAVMIGDTTHDSEVATAMGIDCILVPSGNHTLEKLATSGAQIVDSLVHLHAKWHPPASRDNL